MESIQSFLHLRRLPLNLEFKGLVISALSFLFFPYLIRWVDGSAAAIDPGVLSGVLLAILAVLFFQSVTWWIIKAIWPVFAGYSEEAFAENFKNMRAEHKVLVYLGFYLLLLYAFIAVLAHFI